jgi:hypothetical protein
MICHFFLLAPLLLMFQFFHACYSLLSCTFVACFHCLFLLLVFIALSLSLFIHFCYLLLLLTFVIHFYYLFCSLQQALACSLTTTQQKLDTFLTCYCSLVLHYYLSFSFGFPPLQIGIPPSSFLKYDFIFLLINK